MNNENFDERQKLVNLHLSNHALLIVFVMLVVNGLLKSIVGVTWAEPLAEMAVLVLVPALYYISRSIFLDVYQGKHDTVKMHVIAFLGLGLHFIIGTFFIYEGPIVDSGMLTSTTTPLIAGIFFITIPALLGVKIVIDKQRES